MGICGFVDELTRLRKSSSDSIDNVVNFDSFKKYDISVVATGSAFDINKRDYRMMFHGMSTGMSRSADIILKYNASSSECH